MSKKMKIIPALRFPEFAGDGEWVEKKLGEAADFINGRAYKKEELFTSGNYRVLRVGNFFTNNEWYYSDLELDEEKYCDNGDLLYAWSASFGPRIWKEEKVIYHYHIWKVVERSNINKQFLFVLLDFETENIKAAQARGLGMQHLTKSGIESWESRIPPTVEEQQKIASCLSSLDERIAAHNDKLDALKDHKKGLLQNLFPNNLNHDSKGFKDDHDLNRDKKSSHQANPINQGSDNVPKVRFPQFEDDGDWKIRPLEDVSKITTGNKDTQDRIDDGKYPFFVRSQTIERINSFSFDREAILTSGDGVGVGKIYHYIIGKFDLHQRVYCIYDFLKEVEGKFIFYFFSEHFYQRVMRMSAKNSVDSVRRSMLTEMPIALPPTKEEQQKIASCLSAVDALITAQQEKIEQLQQHKKGLMQGLFPRMTH
jgi:type I restriction enzyme S subunit